MINRQLISSLSYILDFIFPNKCFSCDSLIKKLYLCDKCHLNFIDRSQLCRTCMRQANYICSVCNFNPPAYDYLYSALIYDDIAKEILHKFKYQDQLYIRFLLSKIIGNICESFIENIDIIIFVPMHRFKLIKRKYNQSALIAKDIAKNYKKVFLTDCIIKNKNNIAQVKLTGDARRNNMQRSFVFNKKYANYIKGKNILIIDDIFTTGSTLHHCAKTLEGCKTIYAASFAAVI